MKLPLPEVREVTEVLSRLDGSKGDHRGSFVLIAPDPNAGKRARYSVIRVDYYTGAATCIGRELPLEQARQVAKRPASKDGKPMSQPELDDCPTDCDHVTFHYCSEGTHCDKHCVCECRSCREERQAC